MNLFIRPHITPSKLARLFNLWLPWVVLAVTLGVTILLWHSAKIQVARELQTEFDYSVQETVRSIEKRVEVYKLILNGLDGLFSASAGVTRSEFHNYVETLELQKRYPGVKCVGFSLIVPAPNRAAHIAKIRAEGFPKYDIWPESKLNLVTTAIYIEPFTTEFTQHTFGFDMYTEPMSRAAMERSRDLNETVLTGKLNPPSKTSNATQPVFVLFKPIYKKNIPIGDTASRRANIIGWVHAIFRADSLIDVLPLPTKTRININLYDGEQVSEPARLFGTTPSSSKTSSQKSQITTTQQIFVAGHTWTIEASSHPKLEARFDHDKPRIILFTGIGTSLLLALLMQMLIHGRAHAVRIANEMNSALIKSEYRWKFALEGAREGVWDWDIETGSVFLSAQMKKIFGYDESEQLGNIESLRNSFHPDDRQKMLNARIAYFEGKSPEFAIETRLLCKDGTWRWTLMRGMIVSRNQDGKPLRMIGTLTDITERYARDESLRLSSTVFNTLNEAVMVTDADNHIVSINPSLTKITGYELEDVIGKNPSIFSDGVARPDMVNAMWESLKTTGSWMGEVVNRRKSGELYVAWISISCVHNERGDIINFVGAFSDISERKAIEQRMQYLAHFDPLTDLPNRALFNDRLRQALAICRRNHTHMALLFIDLDKFKPVNDTLGHAVGDLLLKEVAYRMLDNLRESDTAARIGGDEFVVLLSGIETENDAHTVADKILKTIQEPCELDGHTVQISASIGIAVYPEHGLTDEEMLTNADDAMYHAKHAGGSSIVTFGQFRANLTKST